MKQKKNVEKKMVMGLFIARISCSGHSGYQKTMYTWGKKHEKNVKKKRESRDKKKYTWEKKLWCL